MKYILIDGSYFVFYRVFALCVWWRNAKPEDKLDDPALNETFVEKFKSTFIDKIKEMPKKLGFKKEEHEIYVGLDCPQSEIWRAKHFQEYKHGRNVEKTKEANIAYFFNLTMKENLFEKAGINIIFKHDHLEADDCIYLASEKLKSNNEIYIISSDHDYLQLACDNIKIFDLKYKNISESKNSFGCPEKDLFSKIILGDKSDNIQPVFKNKKVGKKTVEKLYENKGLLYEMLSKDSVALEQFEKNTILIDMKHIPYELVSSFNKIYF